MVAAAALALVQASNACTAPAGVRHLLAGQPKAAPRLYQDLELPAPRRPPPTPPLPERIIPPGRPVIRVPILMYHYVRLNPNPRDGLGFRLSVTPADFSAEMDWLAANGYHPVTLADLRAYFLAGQPLPSEPVVLTFDDGYQDFFTAAWPILRGHGFRAVTYVVSGFLGAPGYMTPEEVRELDRAGVEVGAHTVSHVDLTRLGYDELWHQVADSKATLEALLGHPVLDFAYPSGRANPAVVKVVEQAGFQTATTTAFGTIHSASDRFTWMRVRVEGGEPLATFVANLGPPEPAVPNPALVAPLTSARGLPMPTALTLPPGRPGRPSAPPSTGPQP